jgi:hypothetical protein
MTQGVNMEQLAQKRLHRRDFQKLALLLPAPMALATLAGRGAGIALAQSPDATATAPLASTPACGDDEDLASTPPQTEGPFYTPNTPERRSLLEPGLPGTRLLEGGVSRRARRGGI